jgi:three-Cys-motif partner protein
MSEHPRWNGVTYIDMFSGPGICAIRGTTRRIPGSTVIAARSAKPCKKVIAVELNSQCATALEERLKRLAPQIDTTVIQGDCNKAVDRVVGLIPQGSLALAFLDAEGLDFHFETVRVLADGRAVDLLVLFADAYDIVRNVDFYESQDSSRLDRLLGTNGWRERWAEHQSRTSVSICDFFCN